MHPIIPFMACIPGLLSAVAVTPLDRNVHVCVGKLCSGPMTTHEVGGGSC